MHKQPVIKIENLVKNFKVGKNEVPILKGIDLEINHGEFVLIYGASGCGKSTLLNTILGLEVPTSGKVYVDGKDVYEKKEDERARFRHKKFGVVYQQANWIKALNVAENAAFPLFISGVKTKQATSKAMEHLGLFKVGEFYNYSPTELSGGQQQRVAIVRALVTDPKIIVADEPTGSIDSVAAADIMYTFKFLCDEFKKTIVLVTHNPDYVTYANKVVWMQDGLIKNIQVKEKEDTILKEEAIKKVLG
jgi:putative ABC transport system ATP-binding protein